MAVAAVADHQMSAMEEEEVQEMPLKVSILTQIYGENINVKYKLCGSPVRIGRNLNCEIKIENPNVSRIHCVLTLQPEGWAVTDRKSFNGTFVNGIRLAPTDVCILRLGDLIFLGPPSSQPVAFAFDDTNHSTDHYLPGIKKIVEVGLRIAKTETSHPKCIVTENKSADNNSDSSVIKPSVCAKSGSASGVVTSNAKNAANGLHSSKNLKRTSEALQSVNTNFDTPVVSRKLFSNPCSIKFEEGTEYCKNKPKNAISTEICSNSTQDDDSQSLLDMGNIDMMESYPFSQRSDLSERISNENFDALCSRIAKCTKSASMVENSKKLASALASLSEKVQRLDKINSDLLEDYETICQKNKILDQQLAEKKKLEEDLKNCELRVKNDFKNQIMEKFEEDLVCNICTELFIKPTVLDCSHTFCEHCIMEWKKKKKQCPICRNVIQNQTRVLALDHFIDKALATLTPDQKEKRKELMSERERAKVKAAQALKNRRSSGRRRRRRTPRRVEANQLHQNRIPVVNEIETAEEVGNAEVSIFITHASNASEIYLDDSDPEMYDRGPCYNCGEYGHHHYHCPL